MPRWAAGAIRAVVGMATGAVVGGGIGLAIGFVIEPRANPHDFGGFARFFAMAGGVMVGGIAGLARALFRLASDAISGPKGGGSGT